MECDVTLAVYIRTLRAQWWESLRLAEALHAKRAVSDFGGRVQLMSSSNGRGLFEPYSSLFRPYWRESEAQLAKKQAVLLMHDIYSITKTH